MANVKNGAEQAKLVAEWAKAQGVTEKAQEALDNARGHSQAFAKALYEAFGTEPFSVKSLGKKYRAIHKKGGPNRHGTVLQESWAVIPLAENAATREFA